MKLFSSLTFSALGCLVLILSSTGAHAFGLDDIKSAANTVDTVKSKVDSAKDASDQVKDTVDKTQVVSDRVGSVVKKVRKKDEAPRDPASDSH